MSSVPSFLQLPSTLRRRARRSRIWTMLTFVAVVAIFITPLYIIYKPPNSLIRFFQRKWPDVLLQVETTSKTVALTIDDAPSAYTREIMAVLAEYNASATFFVIGSQAHGHEDILQDLVRNGHELGNHAMRDEPSKSLSDDVLVEQINSVKAMITDAYEAADYDPPPDYFRPGSGFFTARMRNVLDDLGYQLVLGSIYPHDAQVRLPSLNAKHILSMLRPGGIIACHDRRSWTVPMLKKILPEMARRGYRVVTITELLSEARS